MFSRLSPAIATHANDTFPESVTEDALERAKSGRLTTVACLRLIGCTHCERLSAGGANGRLLLPSCRLAFAWRAGGRCRSRHLARARHRARAVRIGSAASGRGVSQLPPSSRASSPLYASDRRRVLRLLLEELARGHRKPGLCLLRTRAVEVFRRSRAVTFVRYVATWVGLDSCGDALVSVLARSPGGVICHAQCVAGAP